MFRQILRDPLDRCYQLIFWRFSPKDKINTYALNTVTFGTKPAPFKAQRVIKHLVDDEGCNFPLAISILQNNAHKKMGE